MKKELFDLPKRVTLVDVSPRDGLQSEQIFVPTAKKIELINALISAGIPRIEVTSFVSPKWVPQLADAEQVLSGININGGAQFQVLVANERGYERARATGLVREIAAVVAATESINRKNANMSISESMSQFAAIAQKAKADGVRVRATIGVAFVCPHEGRVDRQHVAALAEELFRRGADEVALADTLGAATPDHVYDLFARIRDRWPDRPIAGHFHDTRQMALANIVAAMQAGATIFDAAVGNLGGCQFTKGARGNVATESVVYMLDNMGIETGVDYRRLLEVSSKAQMLVSRSEVVDALI